MTVRINHITSFLLPWAFILVIGLVGAKYLHSSLDYFSTTLGITSVITLISLWWTGSHKKIESSNALISALVIISFKMFVSGVIFIYYFHNNDTDIVPTFTYGFLLFTLYTSLEVYTGIKFSKNN